MIHVLGFIFAVGFGLSIALLVNDRRYAEAGFVAGLVAILLVLVGYAAGTFGGTP